MGHYKNGDMHGLMHHYQKSGCKTEGYYTNGKLSGILTFFYANEIKERYQCSSKLKKMTWIPTKIDFNELRE